MEEFSYVLSGDSPDGGSVRFVLTGDRLTVGRQGNLLLPQASVSRNHAILEKREEGWIVSDLGSRNGTTVNGVTIQRHKLCSGDIVSFGRVKLRFDVEGAEGLEDAATSAMTVGTLSGLLAESAQSLVGRSDALKSAMQTARRAAKSNATVLIFGESGTGKELFAHLVYEESNRREKPFIPVHSSAIEPSLLGSTLFGHEKGAFTGALTQKKGLFEEADGGTIFLDEIGELSADMQVKLLRVLQEGEFMRVGGTAPIHVDVRVICATNRDLAAAVKEGKFREDLYYRLNVIQISLPPLRERLGDVPDLVRHFISLLGGCTRSISNEALVALSRYPWPGNVRELRNCIERALVLSSNDRLEVGDFPPEIVREATSPSLRSSSEGDESSLPSVRNGKEACIPCEDRGQKVSASSASLPPTTDTASSLAEMERRYIQSVLDQCKGNKRLAAERLGISRSTLYEKLREGCPETGQAGCSGSGHDSA